MRPSSAIHAPHCCAERQVLLQGRSAFTLLEAMIALAIGSIAIIALYAGFTYGFSTVKVTREDLRATEIILQRLERVRLCSFDQITNSTINPATSTEYYDPADQISGAGGVSYTITYSATVPASGSLPDSYRSNMFLVDVSASWFSGQSQHSRSMQTLVARYGIQNYIWGTGP